MYIIVKNNAVDTTVPLSAIIVQSIIVILSPLQALEMLKTKIQQIQMPKKLLGYI